MGKNNGKTTSKNLTGKVVNTVKNFLTTWNNLQQIRLKLLLKVQFKLQLKQLVIWLVKKLLIKSRKFQKKSQQNNSETVNEWEWPKRKYLNKNIYLQKKRQEIIDDLRLI